MARCPLCESDVPDGRSACDICGQPFDRGLTARAALDITKRAIAAARKDLAGRSDFVAAERLLRRISIRTLDQRRERVLQGIVEKAQARVQYAKERGGNVEDAEDHLAEARNALALREYHRIRPLASKAIEKADAQRKYARAETILDRAAADVEAARRDGVNIAEARKVLTQARDALRRGVYADIPLLAQRARNGLQEARRYAVADAGLRESAREASRERRKGVDVSRAEALLDEAETALAAKEYGKVRALAKDAHDAVREASLLQTVRNASPGLEGEAEVLQNRGPAAAVFGRTLVDLRKAGGGRARAAAGVFGGGARHSAESARDSHFRTIMEQSLQIILMNAARGLDPAVARQLLKEVDDAVSLGKRLDMQALIDKRMAEADTETESKLNVRVLQARDDIVALRQGGQNDTMGLEGKLADAAIGIQERRFFHADALLDSVEHDIFATRELMRSSAAEVLGQARGEVARAKADGIHVDAAAQMLRDAETSYSEARYGDTIYAGKACISEVEELAHAAADTKRKSEAEVVRSKLERTEGIHRRMESVRVEIQDLLAHNVDLAHALETLAAAEQAVERGSLEEAEHLVASAEGIVKGVKVTLNHQAKGALERARKAVEQASRDGVEAPEFAALLANAQAAVQAARPAEVLQATGEIDRLLSERRQLRHQDEQRRTLEKARSAATKFITVKKLIMDLRKADIDITGAEESLRAAEQAIEERNFDDVDAILTDLDATAKELMDELVAASRNLIGRAESKIHEARDAGLDVDKAVAHLDAAEAAFERGEYADALEHARSAEKELAEGLREMQSREAEARRRGQEAARAELASIRKTIADLARADISILGADSALGRAEAAFEEGRVEDLSRELTETKEMAARLSDGLEAAAKDLVSYVEREVAEVRSTGLDPGPAEVVLLNAREAINDGRFVEAIEYKKVIEDILDQTRRDNETRVARDSLTELRPRVEAHAKFGADVRTASEILARAEAMIDAGELHDVGGYAKRISEEVDLARKAHLGSVVGSFSPMIEEGVSLGLNEEELDEFRAHAEDAAAADDLEEVYRLKGDLQERLLDAKRHQIVKRSMNEIQSLDELVTQSERLGVPSNAARTHLDGARRAIEEGNVDGFERGLTEARASLEESRKSHFLEKYETRVHAVSTMMANAKRLGAELGDATGSLEQAEAALRAGDIAMADILIKQAEGSVGIQIQNFIKNKYPNLTLRLPSSGLQAGEWNQYVVEIENRGKLPARNVQIEFSGDLEAKGVAPIAEIGVGEVVPVRIGVKPKGTGAVPVAVGITYKRMFDENRYEVRDTKEIKVEPESTYLVEDVFLIHSDGRLIAHHSRKFREEIDEDIFSGMLTVVQDFVKDSFKTRTRVGMKRLDFGDSKILIERSPHTFLATVVVGQEPKLLPLYMLQVLKEVEDRYGNVLEKWTGLLHQLEGVDELIEKLVFVAKDPNADLGALAESPVTLTAMAIDALGTAQATEANELLAKAQSTLETDIQLAWQFIEQARTQADLVKTQLRDRMGEILTAARDTVSEMKS